VTSNQPQPDEGRVVPLRPRNVDAGRRAPPSGSATHSGSDELRRFERGDERDDYRHRMITNVIAVVFTAVLVIAGLWLVKEIAEMRRNQDCVLSGRRSCTPVDVPLRER
jgi:hypothetical protein